MCCTTAVSCLVPESDSLMLGSAGLSGGSEDDGVWGHALPEPCDSSPMEAACCDVVWMAHALCSLGLCAAVDRPAEEQVGRVFVNSQGGMCGSYLSVWEVAPPVPAETST